MRSKWKTRIMTAFLSLAMVLTSVSIPVPDTATKAKATAVVSVSLGAWTDKTTGTSSVEYKLGNLVISAVDQLYTATISVDTGSIAIADCTETNTTAADYYKPLTEIATSTNDNKIRTVSLYFKNGASASVVQSVLRSQLTFTTASLTEAQVVTITVDGNTTYLGDDVDHIVVKELTSLQSVDSGIHYYAYVDKEKESQAITWKEAYEEAKTLSYNGMKGYLVTITSQAEEDVQSQVSTKTGWGGGARYDRDSATNTYDSDTLDSSLSLSDVDGYFRWQCGPESLTDANRKFWHMDTTNGNTSANYKTDNDAYASKYGMTDMNTMLSKWWSSGEPNNTNVAHNKSTGGGGDSQEYCLQLHYIWRR